MQPLGDDEIEHGRFAFSVRCPGALERRADLGCVLDFLAMTLAGLGDGGKIGLHREGHGDGAVAVLRLLAVPDRAQRLIVEDTPGDVLLGMLMVAPDMALYLPRTMK